MAYNKVVYNGQTLIDLTNDTVTPATLDKGVTAHSKSGEIIIGVRVEDVFVGIEKPTEKHKVWIKPLTIYTNQIPISIGTDKQVYNTTGWKTNTRLSASSGTESTGNKASITGFIPVKANDVVRFKFSWCNNATWELCNINLGWNIMAYYNGSFGWVGSACPIQKAVYGICSSADYSSGGITDGGVVTFKVPSNSNIAFLRLSFAMGSTVNMELKNLIVTVNEEI